MRLVDGLSSCGRSGRHVSGRRRAFQGWQTGLVTSSNQQTPDHREPPAAFLGSLDAARIAVDALIGRGVQHVVVSPGSRSAPMAYALAEAESAGRVELLVRIDERSAAFTALGLALASGRPAAALTTSGTAVGNLMPAVMEANHAAVPLVVISADRPEELLGTGANQTTIQLDLFGEHVRFAADVPAGHSPLRAVETALSAAVGALTGLPPGPVQLNFAFRDPLVPSSGEGLPTSTGRRTYRTGASPRAMTIPPAALKLEERRTVVLAGHDAGPVAEGFARAHGLPLFAEPSSNARYGPNAVAPYRLLLEHLGADIECVTVFGRPTLSRPVAALLARPDVERVMYLPAPVAWFEPGRRPERPVPTLAELSDVAGHGAPGWLSRWQTTGDAAAAAIRTLLDEDGPLTGLQVAEAVWNTSDGNLVLGSSNPIRDVDLMASPDRHPLEVYANRGLAGIDGTISTATGIALASGVPTRVLVGDLTFLHDAGGLLLGVGEREPDLQIVVLNDSGGGIFSLLEHGRLGETEEYRDTVERLFGTPHTADLSALAAGYGVPHCVVATPEELDAALAPPPRGRSIVEVRTSRAGLRELHALLREGVRQAVVSEAGEGTAHPTETETDGKATHASMEPAP